MKKALGLLVLVAAFQLSSDDFHYNSANNHGTLGVINIPSARFYDSPAASLSFYRGYPDRKAILSLYPYDWFEASVFYSSIEGKPYGSGFSQSYKDKGFNVKVRLKEEGQFPAIAVGAYDIGGTGYYSSEYIVSSYAFNRFDFHFGASWGRMNHFESINNPFIEISERFRSRDSLLEEGGNFNFKNYFSGATASLFGGINYAINENTVLKLELDPLQTPGRVGFKERKSDISFGLNYLKKNYVIGLNFERGSNFSLNLNLRDNFFIPEYTYKKNPRKSLNKYNELVESLRLNNIGVSEIEKNESITHIKLTQFSHDYFTANDIVNKSIKDTGLTEKIVKTYKIAGLDVIESNIDDPSEVILKKNTKVVNQNLAVNLRPFIAGREDFLKLALLLEHNSEILFSENLMFSTNIKFPLVDNFDDLIYPPVNTYPAQVRSDVKKYLNRIGETITLGRAQLEYFKTLDRNKHVLLTAGIYEEMFSGFGFEYLDFNPSKKISWGFEAHKVFKRDYELNFDLLDYENITYHLNIYYKNRTLFPFDLKASYGEYLAGDKGVTFEFSRSFKKGIEIGFFTSFTDVSSDEFGEGSFDKGIFFKIPFGSNRNISNFVWRPLTKDPASKLIRKNNLYDLVNKYSLISN